MSTCLVMCCVDFLKVWPFQLQFFLLICCSTCSWFVLSHSASLLIVSGHHILRILLRHLFTVLIFCSMDCVVRHVSDPYIFTALIFELNMRSLIDIDISLD